MNKRILSAALCLGAVVSFVAPAEARIDNGPISSLYENDGRSLSRAPAAKPSARRSAGKVAKPRGKQARRAAGSRQAKGSSGSKGSVSGRAVTASHSGKGGASRSCLTSAARGLLGRIEQQFGPVQVISTCRPGARIAGSGKPSKHASGNAVDFNAGGRKQAIVNWLRANHTSGGTMTYARMNHIHVDIGPRFVSLGAGGGKRRS